MPFGLGITNPDKFVNKWPKRNKFVVHMQMKKNEGESEVNLTKGFGLLGLG